ncbi:hypothetical protein E1286_05265 [Nonomuraea terrae]|uniref:Uncharacterized protein n=1 Tax=Nonomuraea terrae TaxID=2530383 RepID=A0A4R4ZA34_9ACTN|nr:hypothetical protein [Nonomuraea terrae]TDD54600.1 hypothetical protein E1286_05265 [Nonomuraea terrae]
MTDRDDENLPDIDEARHAADESLQRAEQELRLARERARCTLSLADRLRRLREENGFHEILSDAFGGAGHG